MPSLKILWEGVDGSTWNLLDPLSPVRALSLDGLGLPDFTQQFSESAAADGRRYEGTTWGANTVNMTVQLSDDYLAPGWSHRRRGEDWRQGIDVPWRRSLSPEAYGRLVAITGAGRRQLELRMNKPAAPPADRNPALRGMATYSYELTADDQPWWQGEEVSAEFRWNDSAQAPFFDGPTGHSLLWISKSSETDRAAIANPGDRPVLAQWWAQGPFAGLTFGIGGETATLPFGLEAGSVVRVDSLNQTIVDGNGQSLWPLMGYADPTFAPIPPGELIPLVVDIQDPGPGALVGLSLQPLFEGPW